MDRNSLIGILLIVAIFVTWSIVTSDPEKNKPLTVQTDSLSSIQDSQPDEPQAKTAALPVIPDSLPDSVKAKLNAELAQNELGVFAAASAGEEKLITMTTEKLKAQFSTKGGKLVALSLNEKDYVTYQKNELFIQKNDPENEFSIVFRARGDAIKTLNSSDMFFTLAEGTDNMKLTGDQTAALVFRASAGEGRYMELKYTFRGTGYDYDLNVNFVGMDDVLKDKSWELVWVNNIPVTEKNVGEIRKKASIFYREGDDVNSLNAMTAELQNYKASQGKLDYVSFNSQFFAQTLLAGPSKPFTFIDVKMVQPIDDDSVVKRMEARIGVNRDTTTLKFYAGPLEYYSLKKYDRRLDRMLNLGWGPLKWINAWVIIPVFKVLENVVGNYGVIILILALMIKLITLPFTHKTYLSMAKMRIANTTPEMKALEEKNKDDQTKLSQEKMALYRKLGANPLGGCVPAILQYPILISMFFFFPQSIELRQQGFLWAEDLSTYDSIWDFGFVPLVNTVYGDHVSLWTLLMTVSIFIYTWVNQKVQGAMNTTPGMQYFPYIMPFLLLGFLNNYSAGLSYYYFLSNILSIAQNHFTKYFVDDNKILDQLREFEKKKAGSTKKGWMEKMVETQQKKQKEIMESKKRK